MDKSYYYKDDIIYNNNRQPNLIITDFFSRIIENENCKTLCKRLNDLVYLTSFPDFRFHDYSTPLLLACHYFKKLDFIEYLIIQKKADVNYSLQQWPDEERISKVFFPNNQTCFINGITPLMSILMSDNIAKEKIVKMLVEKGANVNSKNELNHTPLMCATYYNSINIVTYLINQGANVNDVNIYNYSPLTIAFERDNEMIFKELIKHGGDLNHFLKIWDNVNKIINLGSESLNTYKHEMYFYARKYKTDYINFICNLFDKGIEDPLRDYMLKN